MDMNEVAFAELKPQQVQKIKHLEQELQAELNDHIILLAYEPKSDLAKPQD